MLFSFMYTLVYTQGDVNNHNFHTQISIFFWRGFTRCYESIVSCSRHFLVSRLVPECRCLPWDLVGQVHLERPVRVVEMLQC